MRDRHHAKLADRGNALPKNESFGWSALTARTDVRANWCLGGALLVLIAGGGVVPAQREGDDPWRAAAQQLLEEAHAGFSEAKGASVDDPQMLLGRAAVLLNLQPKTDGRVDRAIELFEKIMTEHSGEDVAVEAEYLRARAEQVHRAEPDLAKARRQFRQLIDAHSGHRLADIASVKFATLEVWTGRADEQALAIQRWNERVGAITYGPARKDLHLLLADAEKYVTGDKAAALGHFIQAEKLGIANAKTRGDVVFQIGEFAHEVGRNDVARKFYEKFLKDFRRDVRRPVVESRLRKIGTGKEGAS
ncbi:MAG: hypothetical protein WA771_14175 [Chthoniobacterales bacterium]